MPTSEERASKKANAVDNESGTSMYRMYGYDCLSRTCSFHLVLLLHDVDYIL